MLVATAVVSVILAALLTLAAVRKLSHQESVVRGYGMLGVPERRLNLLAAVLIAGAAGLLVGLWWAPIGVAAAIGVIAYFAGAIVVHLRARETKTLPTPCAFGAIAVAVLVLRLATA